jgi:signal transduction histidine kinase
MDERERRGTSIRRILAFSLILVTLVPFLPLAVLTLRAYRGDVALLEQEIRATNRQTALLAAAVLGGIAQQAGPARPRAAIGDTDELRRRLAALAPGLDRHVYAVERSGKLLFYSDPRVTQRGDDISANPPIKLFVAGGAGEIRFRSVVSGKERLGYVQPVAGTDWGVIVSADIATSVLAIRDRYVTLALCIGFAAAAALGILAWSSRRLTRPVAEIRAELRRWRAGGPGPSTIAAAQPDIAEYRDLVDALNDLSRRLAATEAELVQAAKASLTGQLASGIAHEIGTPLNVISGSAQYTLRKLGEDDPCRATLQMVVRQTERISAMVQRFLEFSRTPEARLDSVDVAEVARQVVAMVPEINRKVETSLVVDPATPPVLGDPKLLEHALMNLILNGCQAMPGGGRLALEIGTATPDRAGIDPVRQWVRVRVADTGCGIAPEHLGRVFEPFFTTKPLGQGTGLGLAIVDRIVGRHGGWIEAASAPGAGSTFTLWLRPDSASR